ncbi:MAG TPA: DUF2017 family protein [Actinomycetota bacterium]|nr:DUF2017 family protein [Actinomycetota bacterium]
MFKKRRGLIRLTIGEEEAELLRTTIREYVELLDAPPSLGDPVLARLFPSASLDDPALEIAFRDLSASDLDAHKRATAGQALASLDADRKTPLTPEQQEAWLVLLTDLRLAIGVRLGVTEETYETYPNPNDPAQWPLAVLDYLGALLESLVQSLQG